MFWADDMADERGRCSEHPRSQPIPGYATTTLLARRAVFEQIGAFDVSLGFADAVEWFMRASERNIKMTMLPEVLTYHRMHKSNLSRRHSDKSREEYLRIVRGVLRRRRETQESDV